jgi:hypothetical protein
MPDQPATLRRVTDRTWTGTLAGYRVDVFTTGTPPTWNVAIIHPRAYTVLCRSAPDLTDVWTCAAWARKWIEERPLTTTPTVP